MKLVHPDYEKQIDLSAGQITVVFFDNPVIFRKYVSELVQQSRGDGGLFVLSENNEELKIENNLVSITNPLDFEIEDKRITNKISSQIKSFAVSEDMIERTQSMIASLQEYAEYIAENFQYHVSYTEPESAAIMKMLGYRVEYDYQNELEKLLEYMNMIHNICNIGCFVIVNAFSFFSKDELSILAKDCKLLGHSLLFLEGNSLSSDVSIDFATKIVIDLDGFELF